MSFNCIIILNSIVAIIFASSSVVNGYGLIQNVKEGTCLATVGTGQVNAEKTQLLPCDITALNQQWNVMAMIDYDSTPGLVRARTGRCLDGNPAPASGGLPDGSSYVFDCNTAAPVHSWRIINGDFTGTFQLQTTFQNHCLVPTNGGASLLNNVDCFQGSTLQYWRVLPSASNLSDSCKLQTSPFKK